MGKIAAVVVTHNNEATIADCIDSLVQRGIQEIIVVDSASRDKSVKIATQKNVQVLSLKVNKGFGYAANKGVAAVPQDFTYILFCNPDAQLLDSLEPVVQLCSQLPEIGAAGLCLQDGEHAPEKDAYGSEPTLMSLLSRNISSQVRPHKPQVVDWVSGGAMVVKKHDFLAVNGFDERFFLYWEDVDLCRRMREAGKQVYYFPNIRVIHARGHSLGDNRQKTRIYDSSADRYFQKHYAAPIWILQRILRFFYRLASPRVR